MIVELFELERIALFLQASGGGLWDYDVDDGVLYCNDRWHEILGLDPARDQITSLEAFRPHIHPDDAAFAIAVDEGEVLRLLETRENYRAEFRIVRPDGEMRWIRSVASIIRDPESQHLRAIGCITDITEFRTGDDAPAGHGARETMPATRRRGEMDNPALTDKERQCLRWVSLGKTAWETATILGLSRRTVEFHLGNAVRKLDAANKVHAAFIAVRFGLLDEDADGVDRAV